MLACRLQVGDQVARHRCWDLQFARARALGAARHRGRARARRDRARFHVLGRLEIAWATFVILNVRSRLFYPRAADSIPRRCTPRQYFIERGTVAAGCTHRICATARNRCAGLMGGVLPPWSWLAILYTPEPRPLGCKRSPKNSRENTLCEYHKTVCVCACVCQELRGISRSSMVGARTYSPDPHAGRGNGGERLTLFVIWREHAHGAVHGGAALATAAAAAERAL